MSLAGITNWGNTTTTNTQPWISPITTNPYNIWGGLVSTTYPTYPEINKLKNLHYIINFWLEEDDDFAYLSDYVSGIRKNKIIFNGKFDGNRMQPYETIMKFIKEHKKLSVKVDVIDEDNGMPFLIISYTDFEFIEIENNLNFNDGKCDFSVLKVKFKYDKVSYENKKLSVKELREDKLKKINELNK